MHVHRGRTKCGKHVSRINAYWLSTGNLIREPDEEQTVGLLVKKIVMHVVSMFAMQWLKKAHNSYS